MTFTSHCLPRPRGPLPLSRLRGVRTDPRGLQLWLRGRGPVIEGQLQLWVERAALRDALPHQPLELRHATRPARPLVPEIRQGASPLRDVVAHVVLLRCAAERGDCIHQVLRRASCAVRRATCDVRRASCDLGGTSCEPQTTKAAGCRKVTDKISMADSVGRRVLSIVTDRDMWRSIEVEIESSRGPYGLWAPLAHRTSHIAHRTSHIAGRRFQVAGRRFQVAGFRSQVAGLGSQVWGRRSQPIEAW